MRSLLQRNPKSKVRKKGYINIYSKLTNQEKRQIYYKTLYKHQYPDWDETLVYLSKRLSTFLSGKEKLLDFGCGNGNYLIDENRDKISMAVGVDIDEVYVKKNICLDKVIINDSKNLPFEDNTFDVLTSLWVLEHLKHPQNAFNEMYRVLKFGGKLLFCVPNYNYLPIRLIHFLSFLKVGTFLNKCLFGREEGNTFRAYYKVNTLSEIRKIVETRFNIIELRTNYDPSYTSFNEITFKISSFVNRLFTKLGLNYTHPHIIGILEKKQSDDDRNLSV
jgi:SAM-dependent methyltransferase